MKKLSLMLAGAAMLFAASVASAQTVNVGVGLGAIYPDMPSRWGFDGKIFVNYGINKFLFLGLETGYDYVGKEVKSGSSTLGGYPITSNETMKWQTIPLLFTVKVCVPLGGAITPYGLGGIGYSWTIFDFIADDRTFGGFTVQGLIGVDYNLGSAAANMNLFVEGGYRWAKPEAKFSGIDYEIKMYGWLIRAGVSFPIVGGSSYM